MTTVFRVHFEGRECVCSLFDRPKVRLCGQNCVVEDVYRSLATLIFVQVCGERRKNPGRAPNTTIVGNIRLTCPSLFSDFYPGSGDVVWYDNMMTQFIADKDKSAARYINIANLAI